MKRPKKTYETDPPKNPISASDANEVLLAMPPVPAYDEPPCPCDICVSARAEGLV